MELPNDCVTTKAGLGLPVNPFNYPPGILPFNLSFRISNYQLVYLLYCQLHTTEGRVRRNLFLFLIETNPSAMCLLFLCPFSSILFSLRRPYGWVTWWIIAPFLFRLFHAIYSDSVPISIIKSMDVSNPKSQISLGEENCEYLSIWLLLTTRSKTKAPGKWGGGGGGCGTNSIVAAVDCGGQQGNAGFVFDSDLKGIASLFHRFPMNLIFAPSHSSVVLIPVQSTLLRRSQVQSKGLTTGFYGT